MLGLRVARLRVVFKIPKELEALTFGKDITPPGHLAYVEWYTRPQQCDSDSGMYLISYSRMANGTREASIIEVDNLVRIAQLSPNFGKRANRQWTSNTVLDDCDQFYVSNWKDQLMYQTIY